MQKFPDPEPEIMQKLEQSGWVQNERPAQNRTSPDIGHIALPIPRPTAQKARPLIGLPSAKKYLGTHWKRIYAGRVLVDKLRLMMTKIKWFEFRAPFNRLQKPQLLICLARVNACRSLLCRPNLARIQSFASAKTLIDR